ncbi:hypothetical protein [Paracnuella aquatica]|uniref:hypothetical protein n=1 Tax=Paracnuella aquatica TaxID=2268757 RepID=UPI000F509DD2|nr:hypothetical protein [Paracnuella aquatica]RPD51733.1 hypothetical protein DRJ53_03375 [Paracnuella aquatica]
MLQQQATGKQYNPFLKDFVDERGVFVGTDTSAQFMSNRNGQSVFQNIEARTIECSKDSTVCPTNWISLNKMTTTIFYLSML